MTVELMKSKSSPALHASVADVRSAPKSSSDGHFGLKLLQHTSFTSAPRGFNQAPVFPKQLRDSNASNGLFLGSPFSLTEAGPGSYPGIDVSTLISPGPSKTRSKTMNRRLRDCRPLTGSAATLSLYGADRLFLEEGPAPGKMPPSSFAKSQEKKGFCTSVFASEQSRFIPTREVGKGLLRSFGIHEQRKYHRVIPKVRRMSAVCVRACVRACVHACVA